MVLMTITLSKSIYKVKHHQSFIKVNHVYNIIMISQVNYTNV